MKIFEDQNEIENKNETENTADAKVNEKEVDKAFSKVAGGENCVKNVANKVNPNWNKSPLMCVLDTAYFIAKRNKVSGLNSILKYEGSDKSKTYEDWASMFHRSDSPINVMINGLAGFAKSAMVHVWHKHLNHADTDGTGKYGYGQDATLFELNGSQLDPNSMIPANALDSEGEWEYENDSKDLDFVANDDRTAEEIAEDKLKAKMQKAKMQKQVTHLTKKDSGFWEPLITGSFVILYIDELNRAVKRAQNVLFPIINEHIVPIGSDSISLYSEDEIDEERYTKRLVGPTAMVSESLLFTIACQNTGSGFATEQKQDAAGLSRFIIYTIKPEETTESFKEYMVDKFKRRLEATEYELEHHGSAQVQYKDLDLGTRKRVIGELRNIYGNKAKNINLNTDAEEVQELLDNAEFKLDENDLKQEIVKLKAKISLTNKLLDKNFKWDGEKVMKFFDSYNKENTQNFALINNRSMEHLLTIYDGSIDGANGFIKCAERAINKGLSGIENNTDTSVKEEDFGWTTMASKLNTIQSDIAATTGGNGSAEDFANDFESNLKKEKTESGLINAKEGNLFDGFIDKIING